MPLERRSFESPRFNPGPYLAKIVSHLDPKYMGTLEVELLRDVGNLPNREGNTIYVKYLSPFYGVTNFEHLQKGNEFGTTQKSYGFWMVPPDPGTIVMVIFVEGDLRQGYWIGCVQDEYMNFMVPGLAATELNHQKQGTKVPVGEYNKLSTDLAQADTTQNKKPMHPFAELLDKQGLLKDEIRGITTSSARREVPSAVFGISTPGPLDRQSGAPKGIVGKYESKIDSAFVSRLGGTTLVMDDGDDKFIRKKKAHEGPPEYLSLENGEKGGEQNIPNNELFRIRTRTGHQILLHNSEDLIYIGNARGTAWVELTSEGKIDIFAEDSISIHTKNDLNILADRDINLEAGRNINIKTKEEFQIETGKDYNLLVGANGKILLGQSGPTPGDGHLDINAKGHIWQTSIGPNETKSGDRILETSAGTNETKAGGNIIEQAPQIHMNGPGAADATAAEKPQVLKTHSVPDQEGAELTQTIMRRVPVKEPWPHHENLDPLEYKKDKTDRDVDGRNTGNSTSIKKTPEKWKKPLILDTFKKIGK